MIKSIEEYLAALKTELSGVDPAVIQDAMSDAEEHLRDALAGAGGHEPHDAADDALSGIIEKYGTPQEIAAAYKEIELRVRPTLARRPRSQASPVSDRFVGVLADPRAWGAFIYGILSMLTGIMYFTWAVVGVSLSLSVSIIIIGLPITILFLLSLRGVSLIEGRIVEALLGVRMPRRPMFQEKRPGIWARFKQLFTDSLTWSTLGYMILMMPLGTLYFCLYITLFALALMWIIAPLTQHYFDLPFATIGSYQIYFSDYMWPVLLVLGCLVLVGTMHLAKRIGRWHGALAKSMLVKE